MTQADPPFVVRHARRVAAGEHIPPEDQRAYEDALCQLTVLENLEQFVSDQPDTGRYEEDEGKCIWALRVISRFREEEDL